MTQTQQLQATLSAQHTSDHGHAGASAAHSGWAANANSYRSRWLAARANASASSSGCPVLACSRAASACFSPARTCAPIAFTHARRGASSASTPRSTTQMIHPSPSQFQVIQLTGRLTTAVQTRTSNGGTQVASLRLAIQRARKDGEDQGADYVDVTVFGRQAETCAQYLAKGRKVAVEGRLHHSEWDSDTGRRQKLEVIANNVEFLDMPPRAETPEAPAEEAAA